MPKYRVPFHEGARMSAYITVSPKPASSKNQSTLDRAASCIAGILLRAAERFGAQKEKAMKHPLTLLALGAALLLSLPVRAADIDWKTVDAALGKNAAVSGEAFDTVPDERKGASVVTYWSDVPPATKDYEAARDVIIRHIDNLVPSLASQASTQETLTGIVANVDERNDKITVRFPSAGTAGAVTGDFKVQDGLIFNAVRYGDEVEFAVETIKGARTIVELRKR
jgi:Cu/Ag efflux protein CusF